MIADADKSPLVELSYCDAQVERNPKPLETRQPAADLVFLCGSGVHRITELTAYDLRRLGALLTDFANRLDADGESS